jgi:uncharacterized protein YjbI with pentapeptide repeats
MDSNKWVQILRAYTGAQGLIDQWRTEHPDELLNLSRADLGSSDLSNLNLRRVDLSNADLGGCNLTNTNLHEANLIAANLRGANLSHTKLCSADLRSANLLGAITNHTDFTAAVCGWTTFGFLDLSDSIGLETMVHDDPSSVGWETLVRSQRSLPRVFLISLGMPERTYDLLLPAIQEVQPSYYSCFLSYSSEDLSFVHALYQRLHGAGVRVWFDKESMKGGVRIQKQVEEAVKSYDKVVVVLSKAALRSKWVQREIYTALGLPSRKNYLRSDKLFPIALMETKQLSRQAPQWTSNGVDLVEEIRKYPVSDFKGWLDDIDFEKASKRLLKDLEK